jgi:hypothetical protein
MEQPETILKGFIERYVPALAPSLDATFLGNTFLAWLLSALLFALVSIALWIVLQAILVQLRAMTGRTKMRWDDALVDVAGSVSHATYVAVSLFVAVQHLNLPRLVDIAVKGFFLLMLVVEGVKIIERIAISALSARFGRSADADERRLSAAMVLILRVVLW